MFQLKQHKSLSTIVKVTIFMNLEIYNQCALCYFFNSEVLSTAKQVDIFEKSNLKELQVQVRKFFITSGKIKS